MHGIEGYGAHRQIHTAKILDLSGDLPVVITAVDLPEKIEAVIPQLDEMIGEGLVTTEEVRIVIPVPRSGHDLAIANRVCRPSRGVKSAERLVYCQRRRDAPAG